jgi:hypothetical protein
MVWKNEKNVINEVVDGNFRGEIRRALNCPAIKPEMLLILAFPR